ncbi:hypothetical protein LINGRAHAP2_LOCUS16246 [Linum grandiflorum]
MGRIEQTWTKLAPEVEVDNWFQTERVLARLPPAASELGRNGRAPTKIRERKEEALPVRALRMKIRLHQNGVDLSLMWDGPGSGPKLKLYSNSTLLRRHGRELSASVN